MLPSTRAEATIEVDRIPPILNCGGDADILTGSSIEIGRGEVRHKDLVIFGGNVRMYGELYGDLVLFGGNHEIDGKVHGDTVVFGSNVSVRSNANISGDLVSLGGNISKEKGAHIGGDIVDLSFIPFFNKIDWDNIKDITDIDQIIRPLRTLMWTIKIIGLVFLLAITLIIAAVAPKNMDFASAEFKTEWAKALGIGFAVAVVNLILVIIFFIGIISIPLALLLWLAWLVTKWMGLAAIFLFVGTKVGKNLFNKDFQPIVSILIAFAFYFVISLVPFLGAILCWLIGLTAVGLMVLTRFGTMTSWLRKEAVTLPEKTEEREEPEEEPEEKPAKAPKRAPAKKKKKK